MNDASDLAAVVRNRRPKELHCEVQGLAGLGARAGRLLLSSLFMVLGRNLPGTPQLSDLKSNHSPGSVRRGNLWVLSTDLLPVISWLRLALTPGKGRGEAGLRADGTLAFADVMLPPHADGTAAGRMIEVKSSTSPGLRTSKKLRNRGINYRNSKPLT